MSTLSIIYSSIALAVLFVLVMWFVCRRVCERMKWHHKLFNIEYETCRTEENSAN
jgi:hypothetical protein